MAASRHSDTRDEAFKRTLPLPLCAPDINFGQARFTIQFSLAVFKLAKTHHRTVGLIQDSNGEPCKDEAQATNDQDEP